MGYVGTTKGTLAIAGLSVVISIASDGLRFVAPQQEPPGGPVQVRLGPCPVELDVKRVSHPDLASHAFLDAEVCGERHVLRAYFARANGDDAAVFISCRAFLDGYAYPELEQELCKLFQTLAHLDHLHDMQEEGRYGELISPDPRDMEIYLSWFATRMVPLEFSGATGEHKVQLAFSTNIANLR